MREFKVKIVGTTPYMQHRMDDIKLKEWETKRGNIIERDDLATEPAKLAAFHSYIDADGNYYMPQEHIKQSLIKAGGFVKAKVGNASRSMKNIVAAMWRIKEQKLPFRKFDEIDTRSGVNKNVKARIIVHRPKWNEWEMTYTLVILDNEKSKVTLDTIKQIIEYSGVFLGIGSYRPEHTGEFGQFELASIELIRTID